MGGTRFAFTAVGKAIETPKYRARIRYLPVQEPHSECSPKDCTRCASSTSPLPLDHPPLPEGLEGPPLSLLSKIDTEADRFVTLDEEFVFITASLLPLLS